MGSGDHTDAQGVILLVSLDAEGWRHLAVCLAYGPLSDDRCLDELFVQSPVRLWRVGLRPHPSKDIVSSMAPDLRLSARCPYVC